MLCDLEALADLVASLLNLQLLVLVSIGSLRFTSSSMGETIYIP